MRLVVDTNVFISAAIKANSSPFIVVRWIDRHDGLLKSAATEQELQRVLQRPRIAALTIPSFAGGIAGLLAQAELVAITERIAACRDPRGRHVSRARGERQCRPDRLRRCRPPDAESVPWHADREARRLRTGRDPIIRKAAQPFTFSAAEYAALFRPTRARIYARRATCTLDNRVPTLSKHIILRAGRRGNDESNNPFIRSSRKSFACHHVRIALQLLHASRDVGAAAEKETRKPLITRLRPVSVLQESKMGYNQ
jgi:hypothetical protein